MVLVIKNFISNSLMQIASVLKKDGVFACEKTLGEQKKSQINCDDMSLLESRKNPKKNFSFPNLSEASLSVLTHQSVNVTYLAHVFLFLYPKLCL